MFADEDEIEFTERNMCEHMKFIIHLINSRSFLRIDNAYVKPFLTHAKPMCALLYLCLTSCHPVTLFLESFICTFSVC